VRSTDPAHAWHANILKNLGKLESTNLVVSNVAF